MNLFPLSPALKNMTLYGSSIILMKGVSLFMLPYVANHIPQSELGRLELLSTFAMVLSVILGLSLHEALYRFAGAEQDPHQKRKITAEIFTLTMIVACISLPIIWLISPFISEIKPEYATTIELELLLMVLAFEGVVAVVLASLRMRDKAGLFFIITTGRAFLQVVLTVAVLQQGYGVTAILLVGFIAASLQIIALIYLQVKENKKVNNTSHIYNPERISQCLHYALPLTASGLIAFGLNGFERWVLVDNTSLNDVALYAVALKFSLALTLLMQPFCMWWMPKRFDYLQAKGEDITAKMTQTSLVLLCTLTIIVSYLAPLLIEALMPVSYLQAKSIVIALIIVAAIKEMNELINIGALAKKETKKLLWINSLSTALGMFLIIMFTPNYGMTGVLGSLIVAQSIRMVATYFLSQHSHLLPYSLKKMTLLFIFTGGSVLLSLSGLSSMMHLLLGIACTVICVFIASILKLIILPDSKEDKEVL